MATGLGPCPVCRVELVRARAAVSEITACARCGGVWLDTASSRRVIEGLLSDAERLLAERVRLVTEQQSSAPAYRASAAPSVRRCPECGEELGRTRVTELGIVLDVCAVHGTWFDAGELDPVAQLFAIKNSVAAAEARQFASELAEARRRDRTQSAVRVVTRYI